MLKENILKLKKANKEYTLNSEYELTENLFKYVKERIVANKKEIEELIKEKEENINIQQITEIFNIKDEDLYKNYKDLTINKNFLSTYIDMPIGVIAVECYDTIETIKYFAKAIETRNAIAISDVEYDEYNVKSLILIIIKEALRKFNIDENLIMILPYEECFYEEFDEVIYTYDKEGNTLKTPNISKKQYGNKNYVYIEDEELRNEAIKNEDTEILKGNIEEVIEKIGKQNAAVIYTKNSEKAYKFINQVKCKNVFVNTNLENIKEVKENTGIFYETKRIIIPIPQEEKKEIMDLTVQKKSIISKIKDLLKKLFKV